ncbi:hypothetical protein PAAG_07549 [Paracoccidioides lutzii Pb01]|uniref:Hemerythrin-like domain-containing protein n=1 Tax=Paracoccidioides lutzii (strain ATCC MYA-826 / Pb01) TaxID=502779 RepID=C1H9V8_PARBA|nr:hypothetical protein PAAG_07549 [Paracoccidioides lutzii Pb01]EEH37131.2 hypothetical protein PAAG_07549 [Paracoccidioides lutzii Pb01]
MFRNPWTTLYDACLANELPKDMTLDQLIEMGTNFCNDLKIHRTAEKEFVFPHLGQRMPEFTEKA